MTTKRQISKILRDARNFPHNTCPASRHAALIAHELARKGDEESLWKAESIATTVAALWKARTRIGELEARQ